LFARVVFGSVGLNLPAQTCTEAYGASATSIITITYKTICGSPRVGSFDVTHSVVPACVRRAFGCCRLRQDKLASAAAPALGVPFQGAASQVFFAFLLASADASVPSWRVYLIQIISIGRYTIVIIRNPSRACNLHRGSESTINTIEMHHPRTIHPHRGGHKSTKREERDDLANHLCTSVWHHYCELLKSKVVGRVPAATDVVD
jgi:hypothetical protein